MRTQLLAAALAATTLLPAGDILAQPGTPPAARGASAPRGPMGPHVGRNYTPGWSMMTPAERDRHREQMHGAKTAQECRQVLEEHRKWMAERAKERGAGGVPGPRRDACANWGG